MKHTVEQAPQANTLHLTGEVDLGNSPELRQLLLAQLKTGKHLNVSLQAVEYMDSSGIAALVEAMQLARDKGLELVLQQPSQSVRRVLELARLDKVFRIE